MSDTNKIFKNIIVDGLEILIISTAMFALAWIFLAEPLEVSGDSMTPTLHNKEQIIVEKISMNFSDLKHGDVVVFTSPENEKILVVKRLIGLPGDKIKISEGNVYLNGEELDEDYVQDKNLTAGKTEITEDELVEIPANEYLVLGDNRNNSMDSRDFGLISQNELLGKAVLVYYPFENIRLLSLENE